MFWIGGFYISIVAPHLPSLVITPLSVIVSWQMLLQCMSVLHNCSRYRSLYLNCRMHVLTLYPVCTCTYLLIHGHVYVRAYAGLPKPHLGE